MRKAMVQTELATMVFIAASLFVVVGIILYFSIGVDKILEDKECQSNIQSHSNILRASGEADTTDIYCPTKYYSQSARNPENLNKAVAESLRVCWSTWGEGDLQLFREEGLYCHICSTLKFSDKDVKSNNFQTFLLESEIQDGSGKGKTYAQYLHYTYSGDLSDEEKKLASLEQPISLDSSKEYASIFIYAKGKNAMTQFFEFVGGGTALTGGAVSGGVAGVVAGGLVVGGGVLVLGTVSGGTAFVIIGAGAVLGSVIGTIKSWIEARQPEYVALTLLTEYNAESLKQIGCAVSPTKQDLQKEKLG